MSKKELVFSFDTGLQSGGEAIRYGDDFLYAASNELDESYGSLEGDQRKRRLKRQRFSYHARIDWLNQQCLAAGLPVYHNLKRVDKFKYTDVSTPEDKKIMSSAVIDFDDLGLVGDHRLLRVHILEGRIKELKPWQIYIALHGAIRKRGYQKVSWADHSEKENEKEKEKEHSPDYLQTQFGEELQTLLPDEKYQLTCYYELISQGLWDFSTKTFVKKADHSTLLPKTSFNSGYTCSREIIYKELRILLDEVKKVFPRLDVDLTLYGPCRFELKTDADLKKLTELNLRSLYEREILGVLGQKIPRFDNRILSKCSIFPHLNVVRKDDPLAIKFHYYSKVFNHHFTDQRTGEMRRLTPSELHIIVDYCLKCKLHAKNSTEKSLARILSEIPNNLQLEAALKENKLELPRTSGRSRFSRPALYFLLEYFRRGDASVLEFYNWCLDQPSYYGSAITIKNNFDMLKGLREIDFFWLKKWVDENRTWNDGFYVPNVASMISKDPETKYREILCGLKHPLVRQRAILFRKRLKKMAAFSKDAVKKQAPDKIVIEFVREDFSQKRKEEENSRIKELTEKNNIREGQLLECIKDLKASEQNAILKNKRKYFRLMKLAEEQDYIDLFSDRKINALDIIKGLYDEAHIVPESQRGSGEMKNLILMRPEQNQKEQKDRTFYEWLNPLGKWAAFKKRVKGLKEMPKHKKKLLMSTNPREIFESKQGLYDTSYIASAFRQIASLEFGWTDGIDSEGSQRIFLVRGKNTGWFRGVLGLNKLLNTDKRFSKSKESKSPKKKREKDSDKRNHGLDAMCLSYLANIRDMRALEETLNNSEKVAAMKHQISTGFGEKLFVRRLTKAKGNIEENFVGIKQIKNSPFLYVVRKSPVSEIAYTVRQQKKEFDLENLEALLDLNSETQFNPKIFTKVFTDLRSKYPKNSEFKKAIFSKEEGCPIYIKLRKLYEELISKKDTKNIEAEWVKAAGNFKYKDGTSIKVLKKMTLIEKIADGSELEDVKKLEYADGSPYGIKTKGNHPGYIIYKNEKNQTRLERIYAYEGKFGAAKRLNIRGNFLVLQTGDWVRIKTDVDENLRAGSYKLKTISGQSLVFDVDPFLSKSVRFIGLNNIEKIEYPIP